MKNLLLLLSLLLFVGCHNSHTGKFDGQNPKANRPVSGAKYKIMGTGKASEEAMFKYVRQYNHKIDSQKLRYIVKTYIWESYLEGVNHDVAFAQMCHETNFLKFGGAVDAKQNNFCGLGSLNYDIAGTCFPSVKDGVRAHIQHLKAYGSRASLKNKCIDPRFDLIQRGVANSVRDLTGRWATDGNYGNAIEKKINVLLSM